MKHQTLARLLFASTFALAAPLGVGCDGDSSDGESAAGVDISGAQAGGSVDAPEVAMGEWVDVGDGVKVAVLGLKVAPSAGGMMIKDSQVATVVKLQYVNEGDAPVNMAVKPFKLLAGEEQHGAGMGSAAATVAFQESELTYLPSVMKLLPGQTLVGWTGFAPEQAEADALVGLVGRGGNPVAALDADDTAARVPLEAGSDMPPLSTDATLRADLSPGDVAEGGAVSLKLVEFGPAENATPQDGGIVYTATFEVTNTSDVAREISKVATVGSSFQLIDTEGGIHQIELLRQVVDLPSQPVGEGQNMMERQVSSTMQLATWKSTIGPGESTQGMIAFELPAGKQPMAVVGDTGLGYELVREAQKALNSPVGVWAVGE